MRHRYCSAVSVAAIVLLLAAAPTWAQSQLPRPGQLPSPGGPTQPQPQQRGPQQPPPAAQQRGQQQPPPAAQQRQQAQQPQQQQTAAPKPYKAVAIGAPAPVNDPSFEAFRKQIVAAAEKKDRKALAGLVVAQGFFWMGEKGDRADKKRSGVDNLAKAISLDAKDGSGWDSLAGYAADPTGTPMEDRKDTICAPAEPTFNDKDLEELIKATGTEDGDWGYPTRPDLEMRASAQPNAPVVEKLGMHFVRVIEDNSQGNQDNPMVHVVAPSGKTGFVPGDAISPLGNDQICYVKAGGAWKIAGFVGGE